MTDFDIDQSTIDLYRSAVARKALYRPIKRLFDVLAATMLLAVLGLPMLLTAIVIRHTSAGPILYRSPRDGLNGKRFQMLKFRSMRVADSREDAEFKAQVAAAGLLNKSHNDPRVTPFGRWMRRRSVDELPQLINVLRGEMSIIGPRPVMLEMLRNSPGFSHARALVRPGITGLWQVRDRNHDTHIGFMWPHDLEYVDTFSPMTDLKVMIRTAAQLLGAGGGR